MARIAQPFGMAPERLPSLDAPDATIIDSLTVERRFCVPGVRDRTYSASEADILRGRGENVLEADPAFRHGYFLRRDGQGELPLSQLEHDSLAQWATSIEVTQHGETRRRIPGYRLP